MSSTQQAKVKNRAPAPIQISAEQILREAADHALGSRPSDTLDPIVKIHDSEEYQSHLRDRRKHFEDNIRYRREHIGNWVKYARFEEDNREYERARSVFERALEVEGGRNGELWLRYAEMEMRNEFVNRARNVLDRAVVLLPRVDYLWYKYVYMEEMVAGDSKGGGDAGSKCRAVFERWMEWLPDDNAYLAYARFELRQSNPSAAEEVMTRYANAYPSARSFLRFAKWAEFEAKNYDLARKVYESTLVELEPEESRKARVFSRFAAFEERRGEYDRARVIYKHAVKLLGLGEDDSKDTNAMKEDDDREEDESDPNHVSKYERQQRKELYRAYIAFEKKRGDKAGIEDIVLTGQRVEYEKRVASDPMDYDAWFEYAKMEQDNQENYATESAPDKSNSTELNDCISRVREIYERAISHPPPPDTSTSKPVKQHWRRYIYLFIYYAIYEELQNHDLDRASQIYNTALELIPHSEFSFSKMWINAAKLQIRAKNLAQARKILGRAIGLCGKEKIFVEYIGLELALGEVDRCRVLYGNYLKAMPWNCRGWVRFAELEKSVGETERCRAIYELATTQPTLDMPETLWKSYIDFEIEEAEPERARALYERLLEKTGHVKVWISYALFEGNAGNGGIGRGVEAAREIFSRANDQLKSDRGDGGAAGDASVASGITAKTSSNQGRKEERVLLLDAWRSYEKSHGTSHSLAKVDAMLPRRVKRKRMRTDEDGTELGWEEYFDYTFPEEGENAGGNLKILEMAAKWKKQMAGQKAESEESSSEEESDSGDEEE